MRMSLVLRAARRTARRAVMQGLIATRKRQTDRPPPDFIIVGAQRCGTTSLFRALSAHPALVPNVIGSKGVHYFDTNYHHDTAWYLAHFASRAERDSCSEKTGHKAIAGEASPYYLYHPACAERMARTVPDAKLVVLLRDPVKRAISHHLHMVWEGHEPIADIDEALDLESTRLQGLESRLLTDPSFVSRSHQHFSYMARGHYAEQLDRLFKHFDQKNVLVMATEKLVSDSETSLAKIQSFIGLEPDPTITLEKRNASSKFEPRPETLQRLKDEFAESNKRLATMMDLETNWL